MSRRTKSNRVDDNQAELDAIWRFLGAKIIPMTGDPSIGFDRLIAYHGKLFVVEVKDGSKPPCERELTQNEINRREQLESVGVKYHVVESIRDALEMIR